ncbi:MAG: ABC transporter substrate-binding protein [Halioglobus sp.]
MRSYRTVLARVLATVLAPALLLGCTEGPWNDPNPPSPEGKITYQSVISPRPPKHLDPAISYASDESLFLMQIYQPPMAYHFLKRPYELIPQSLLSAPTVEYLDSEGTVLSESSEEVAFSRYTLNFRSDQQYQPHPAFVVTESGDPHYLFENAEQGSAYTRLDDFPQTSSRSVRAEDYAYGIKRLADPFLGSPMLSFMGKYIVGMKEFSEVLQNEKRDGWLDLDKYQMKGLDVVDDHTLTITIKGRYPQFVYWLAMHFFSPIPREVDQFYSNPGFAARNLTLDWWPVGSGPFMMVENNPNSQIVLERNPNYPADFFPSEGGPGDLEAGFLEDAGKKIPFIDRAVFRIEKEVLPLWTKFLQGYYDRSGELHANTTGVFDQAFVVGPDGLEMSGNLAGHNITLSADVKPSLYYYGFNMRDPVVGGYTPEKRKLRQALQIAFNTEENINIFYKGNGIASQSPIPPGIPGYLEGEAGMNPYVYDWVDGKVQRKSIEYAKKLLAEAGYPNGRDSRTGEPLKIFIDVQSQAISNTSMRWMDRIFDAIGVQVEYRPADWNRTREKLLTGNTQIYSHGWLADYPDPENFLFLLYGPESPLICKCDGANNSNYENEEFDRLFERMKAIEPGAERDELVARLIELFRRDAVWLYGWHPKEMYLNNEWVHNTKRHGISKGTLKYIRIDAPLREQRRAEWNQPVTWPLYAGALIIVALFLPAVLAYRRRQNATAR